jgi:hypothetical protein
MSFVAVAIGGAAVIGAGASIISGNAAASAAKQNAAANNALQADIYSQNKQVLSPYVQAGIPATNSIQALLGLTNNPGSTTGTAAADAANAAFDTFRNSSGYQFTLDQANKASTAALGRAGMLQSGAAVKSAANLNANIANQSFGQYLAALNGQQAVGVGAASAQTGVANNYAGAVTANNNGASAAQQSAYLNTGAAINSGLSSITSAMGVGSGLKSSYGGGGGNGGGYVPSTVPTFNPAALQGFG